MLALLTAFLASTAGVAALAPLGFDIPGPPVADTRFAGMPGAGGFGGAPDEALLGGDAFERALGARSIEDLVATERERIERRAAVEAEMRDTTATCEQGKDQLAREMRTATTAEEQAAQRARFDDLDLACASRLAGLQAEHHDLRESSVDINHPYVRDLLRATEERVDAERQLDALEAQCAGATDPRMVAACERERERLGTELADARHDEQFLAGLGNSGFVLGSDARAIAEQQRSAQRAQGELDDRAAALEAQCGARHAQLADAMERAGTADRRDRIQATMTAADRECAEERLRLDRERTSVDAQRDAVETAIARIRAI